MNIVAPSPELQRTPQVDEIWEDLTPGYHRLVRVCTVRDTTVAIERVERHGTPPSHSYVRARRAVRRSTALDRFNGKAYGFRFVERYAK